jgi:hypothetical protein
MQIPMPSIPEDRPLTAEEVRLARWMLENGEPDGRDYVSQLESARIVSCCPCGCATIDLEVEGYPPARGISRILGEFSFFHGDDQSVIFIYADKGVLGGIEVCGLTGDSPSVLPAPEALYRLVPIEEPGPE